MTSVHRHIPTDYKKFTQKQYLDRIKSLEQYVKWLEKRLAEIEKTRQFFHGGSR